MVDDRMKLLGTGLKMKMSEGQGAVGRDLSPVEVRPRLRVFE